VKLSLLSRPISKMRSTNLLVLNQLFSSTIQLRQTNDINPCRELIRLNLNSNRQVNCMAQPRNKIWLHNIRKTSFKKQTE